MAFDPDMSGKKCLIAGARCPGRWPTEKEYGCPHWVRCTIDGEPSEGCDILIRQVDSAQTHMENRRIQAAIESNRNKTIEAVGGLGVSFLNGIERERSFRLLKENHD